MQYMVQKMSYGARTPTTYYRKQRNQHPSAEEKKAFTMAAMNAYAAAQNIAATAVEVGDLRTGQAKPTSPNAVEI